MKRYAPFWAKALVTVVAATAGGAAAGYGWALLSDTLVPSVRAELVFALAVVLVTVSLFRVAVLQRDVETPQSLMSAGPLIWAAGNGALLGVAVTSRIGFWAWYVLPLGMLYLSRPDLGLLIGGTYGFVRLAVLVAIAVGMRSSDDAAARLSVRMIELRGRIKPTMTVVTVVAAVTVGVGAA
jgi:hypothetical protein